MGHTLIQMLGLGHCSPEPLVDHRDLRLYSPLSDCLRHGILLCSSDYT